jgi:hypothetical protein
LIAAYAFLELVSGKVFHELREDGLANVHPSLSRPRYSAPKRAESARDHEKLSNRKIRNSPQTTDSPPLVRPPKSLAGQQWVLEEATAINDSGQIVGYGVNPEGQTDAYLIDIFNV